MDKLQEYQGDSWRVWSAMTSKRIQREIDFAKLMKAMDNLSHNLRDAGALEWHYQAGYAEGRCDGWYDGWVARDDYDCAQIKAALNL